VREVSNNACESAPPDVVLGRKNWLLLGNEDGAVNHRIVLSLD
jgi:hypothetical protein